MILKNVLFMHHLLLTVGPLTAVLQESIADFLAADGYEVWVIDLRGNGKADKQSRVDIELEWNIDDYLVQVRHKHFATCCAVHSNRSAVLLHLPFIWTRMFC